MLILLPPSETKRPGGGRKSLDLGSLALPSLQPQRELVVDALIRLSEDEDHAARVLKLGPSLRGGIADNATLRASRTMPAMDRYTGVLYDALDAQSLDRAARGWLGRNVLIHSAPFGPVAASDLIPSYRLGAATRLPGLDPLRRLWAAATTGALAEREGPILDLRSEAYVDLGPVPDAVSSVYVRVVTEGSDGQRRALNHFNKHAKGALVRSLAESRPRLSSLSGLRRWALANNVVLQDGEHGELLLVV